MRYRANTRLKGAPKHRGSLPFTEAEIQHTAEVLVGWSSTDPPRWSELKPFVQQSWLVEAEMLLQHKYRQRAA